MLDDGYCRARGGGPSQGQGFDARAALQDSLSILSVLPASFTRLLLGNFGVTLNSDRDCIEVILMRNPSVAGRE